MILIPDTSLVTFGFEEAKLGLADYSAMTYYAHSLSQNDGTQV